MSKILAEKKLADKFTIQLAQGDLTLEQTDAIVNAANEYLDHGGGVAFSIVQRGGDVIQEESGAWVKKHGLVSHARPAWTSGGALPAKFVIHAVGPVWGDGDEDAKLRDAVYSSLRVADELKLESISMPAISTGIFGFPKDRAARIMLDTINKYFEKEKSNLKIVRVTLFDDATVNAFNKVWEEVNA
ncbi:MAG: macro domain-containing protein [Anaerolineales bacterium]|nr:macro domain-containing protein [Anaerolineales bacterium]